jgi:hypothetical protein
MSAQNTVLRSMHDTGLAAWFGGSLMGAVGLNGGAAAASDPADRLQVASVGWGRWAPVSATALGAHLAGATGILLAERRRVAAQRGVMAMSAAKTALTLAALGATAYTGVLGRRMARAKRVPVMSPTEPAQNTPMDVAAAQRQQRVAQWTVPVLTGALLAISSLAGVQQKPGSVARGIGGRIMAMASKR